MINTPTTERGAGAGSALGLAHRWLDALNRRDGAALGATLSDDFLYSAMARSPKELVMRWTRDEFLSRAANPTGSAAIWKNPVVMTIVSELDAGDRAVLEAEGQSELMDGYVYANVYCFNFWTRDGMITEIHDYCCTHTAWLLGEHIRGAAGAGDYTRNGRRGG